MLMTSMKCFSKGVELNFSLKKEMAFSMPVNKRSLFFVFIVYRKVLRNNTGLINGYLPSGSEHSLNVLKMLLYIVRGAWALEDDCATEEHFIKLSN